MCVASPSIVAMSGELKEGETRGRRQEIALRDGGTGVRISLEGDMMERPPTGPLALIGDLHTCESLRCGPPAEYRGSKMCS